MGVEEVRVVRGNNEAEDEKTDDVEEGNAPEDLLDSLGESLSGVGRLSSSKTDQLGTTEGERGGNEDTAETLEAIAECSRLAPVLCTNVAAGIGRNSAGVDDNTKNDEANTCDDLDDGEDKFNFAVSTDTEELNGRESNEEDGNPYTNVDVGSSFPEVNGDRGGGKFEGKNGQPLDGVLPTDSETPGLVNETAGVSEQIVRACSKIIELEIDLREECTVDGVQDCKFSQSLHRHEQHEACDREADDQGCRSSRRECSTSTNKETCTNGTTDGNHLHVSVLERTLELILLTSLNLIFR